MFPTACDRVLTVLTAGSSNSDGADRFFVVAAAGFNPPLLLLLLLLLSLLLSPSLLPSWTPSPTVESAVFVFASFHGCNLGMPAISSSLYNLYACGKTM